MTEFVFKKRPLYVAHALSVLILSLVLIMLDQTSPRFHAFVTDASILVRPLQLAVQWPTQRLHHLSNSLDSKDQLLKENQTLKQSLLIANTKIQSLETINQQNQSLRALAVTQKSLKAQSQLALVTSISKQSGTYVINKGKLGGVQAAMAVLNQQGVLGQVISVLPNSATVRLLSGKRIAIPVKDERSQFVSVVHGDGSSLILAKTSKTTDIKKGDVFKTTGLGGVYPANVPVAIVTEVKDDNADGFLHVVLKPVAHLNYQLAVLVVGGGV